MATPLDRSEGIEVTQADEMRDYCKTVREYVSQSEWESTSSCFGKHV